MALAPTCALVSHSETGGLSYNRALLRGRKRMASVTQGAGIDTVIFDLGNVLIDWNPRHLYRKLFDDVESMESFLSEVCNAEWNERQDAGRSWHEGIEAAMARHPGHAEMIRAFHERWEEMLGGPIHDSIAVLEELRDTPTRLLALTNWSSETFPIALERYAFLHWFEGILVSGHEGLIKPDPAIFRLLISRFGIEASRAVFIDDSIRNVEGARQVGLHAIHFSTADKLRIDLRVLGLPVDAPTNDLLKAAR